MSDRETKTLAEASADELLAEVVARSDGYVIGVLMPSDKGKYHLLCGGSVLHVRGLAPELNGLAVQFARKMRSTT